MINFNNRNAKIQCFSQLAKQLRYKSMTSLILFSFSEFCINICVVQLPVVLTVEDYWLFIVVCRLGLNLQASQLPQNPVSFFVKKKRYTPSKILPATTIPIIITAIS